MENKVIQDIVKLTKAAALVKMANYVQDLAIEEFTESMKKAKEAKAAAAKKKK